MKKFCHYVFHMIDKTSSDLSALLCKKFLIIGATGAVGSSLVKLIKDDYRLANKAHLVGKNQDEVSKLYNKQEFVTFSQYKKIVDEGSRYGCPSITAQGDNEPFLIKNMEQYIYYAHKKNFIDIMTNTNGSPINLDTSSIFSNSLEYFSPISYQ